VWGLYRPIGLLRIERFVETRELLPAEAGLGLFYALAALSGVAAMAFRRPGGPTALPCVGLIATVSVTAALTYGTTRFRAPADVGLVVLASAGVSVLAHSRRRPPPDRLEQSGGDTGGRTREAAAATGAAVASPA